MECFTYRWKEHVGPGDDYHIGYRGKDELAPWQRSDQVARVGAMLGADARQRVDVEVEAAVADAIAFAEKSPFPKARELMEHVYAR
jgi:pyruvate dehydrogenase E1 component alpha subunit